MISVAAGRRKRGGIDGWPRSGFAVQLILPVVFADAVGRRVTEGNGVREFESEVFAGLQCQEGDTGPWCESLAVRL